MLKRFFFWLVFFLLISLSVYGQRVRLIGGYERKMDSIAMMDFSNKLRLFESRGGINVYYPVKWVKISFSRSGNSGVFGKLNFGNLGTGGPLISDLTANDIFGIYTYDIRVRVYMTSRLSFVSRVVATGFAVDKYNYSWGLRYRF